MQLKRFNAPDMRTALKSIKEELGADAVIMSNTSTDEGVEIVAGIDDSAVKQTPAKGSSPGKGQNPKNSSPKSRTLAEDEVSISGRGSETLKEALKESHKKVDGQGTSSKPEGSTFAKSLIEILERQKSAAGAVAGSEGSPASEGKAQPKKREKPPLPISRQEDLKKLFTPSKEQLERERELEKTGMASFEDEGSVNDLGGLKDEVRALRHLLQFELAGLIKESRAREEPVRAMTLALLEGAGFESEVAEDLIPSLGEDISLQKALEQVSANLMANLRIGEDEIVKGGGVISLIGPSGVGKTTTIAKLAARFVMRYGADNVALVTSDHFRIGAVEQIKTYGRIMGCETCTLKSLDLLGDLLKSLKDKSLVLLDTAGMGLKDERFGVQVAQLKDQSSLGLKNYLVLPATSRRQVLDKAWCYFNEIPLAGLILTKVDESDSLGDALSLCLKRNLTLSYITVGQKVPEDINVPDPKSLVELAFRVLDRDDF